MQKSDDGIHLQEFIEFQDIKTDRLNFISNLYNELVSIGGELIYAIELSKNDIFVSRYTKFKEEICDMLSKRTTNHNPFSWLEIGVFLRDEKIVYEESKKCIDLLRSNNNMDETWKRAIYSLIDDRKLIYDLENDLGSIKIRITMPSILKKFLDDSCENNISERNSLINNLIAAYINDQSVVSVDSFNKEIYRIYREYYEFMPDPFFKNKLGRYEIKQYGKEDRIGPFAGLSEKIELFFSHYPQRNEIRREYSQLYAYYMDLSGSSRPTLTINENLYHAIADAEQFETGTNIGLEAMRGIFIIYLLERYFDYFEDRLDEYIYKLDADISKKRLENENIPF
ncbi:MAG: hypothetical protein KDJ62_06270 [Rhodobiaceae bacterium]|nr:hypothetical protein [Rhodobiaceae bacterium]MCC0049592.1 hypothetical protein [Rhodobiaceae bacterium]